MGLKSVLARLKLVEFDGRTPSSPSSAPASRDAAPSRAAGGGVDLEQLLRSMPEPKAIDERTLTRAARAAPAGGETAAAADVDSLPIPEFAAIYRSAGVEEPAHGFSAFKVLEILSAPEFASLEGPAKAVALAGFLKMNPSGPVPIGDVIQDAVRRDQALDRFEDFLRQKLQARAQRVDAENAALQGEIDELLRRHRQRIEENRAGLDRERLRFDEWRAAKGAEERRLAAAVAPFVEENPISRGAAE